MTIWDKVTQPNDIATFSDRDMRELADAMRTRIIDVVSRNGGHLAPSLGTVELTLALHSVFQSPRDKLVWDVGHQAYGHKLLTGRYEAFESLRKLGGISGFLRRVESEHDQFGAGHASTSIAAALGMAKARDLMGLKHSVVAIVGDGALTGGLAYESLNNAGHDRSDLIVVLNDNSMSISPNVGAVSTYLTRLRSGPAFSRFKQDVESVLKRIPMIGEQVAETAERLKDGVKHVFVPGALFEELGFTYLGPIDGHNVRLLQKVLARARDLGGPVLVHAVTRKGQGYVPAENDPGRWHGTSSFDPKTGKGNGKPASIPSWSAAFGAIVSRIAEEDRRIVAITAAMPDGTGLQEFARAFPNRFFDVGIAEQHAVTFAAGLATQGMRPVVAIYSTFLQRAYDQIIHDVALQDLPVIFCLDRAGLVGEDGPTHNGAFDLAYLRCVPGMTIIVPRNEAELEGYLRQAIERGSGPVAFRYPRGAATGIAYQGEELPWGRGNVLREGHDVAILAIGPMVEVALAAAAALEADGVTATVADMRFVKPLDAQLVRSLRRGHDLLVTIEDASLVGGFGGSVLEFLNAEGGVPRLLRFGLPDRFVEQGGRSDQLKEAGLTAEQIAQAVRQQLQSSHAS